MLLIQVEIKIWWDLSMMTRLKELEAENAPLKRVYADERLKSDILQDALSKKF